MKKAAAVFFLSFFLFPHNAFAQESRGLVVPADFRVTKIFDRLEGAELFTFDFEGNFIFVHRLNNARRITKLSPAGEPTVLLERFSQPILGLSFHKGKVYIITRGNISVLEGGRVKDIISGLPAEGDYSNSSVIFQDGKMYFSVGTVTNSGIVGPDNSWLASSPSLRDLPCTEMKINQVNVTTDNFLTKKRNDKAVTGSFMPFNTPTHSDTLRGSHKCNGAIMQADPDGRNLVMYAHGLHNPKGLSFDPYGSLYALDQAMEDRGVRPVKGGRDSLYKVVQNVWHGWPDFSAGEALESPLAKDFPPPPKPEVTFDAGHLSGFQIDQFRLNSGLAVFDGKKISQFGLSSSDLRDFVTLALPQDSILQTKFGPDKNLYVLTSDNKTSQLYKIESLNPVTATSTIEGGGWPVPMNWMISLSTMILGMGAVYYVYRNQQKNIGI